MNSKGRIGEASMIIYGKELFITLELYVHGTYKDRIKINSITGCNSTHICNTVSYITVTVTVIV